MNNIDQHFSTVSPCFSPQDLEKALREDLSGDVLKTLLAMLDQPSYFDAKLLNKAMKGAGTDEDILIELLCTRANSVCSILRILLIA